MSDAARCYIVVLLSVSLCGVVSLAKNVDNLARVKRTSGLDGCDNVRPFFQTKNITLDLHPQGNTKGRICGGQCCDDRTETLLRKQGQRDFATLLRHNSRSLQGLLDSTSATLQNHVSELAHQSENKTLVLFSQVYRGMAVLSRQPIETLYTDIRTYVRTPSSELKPSSTPEDIVKSVTRFFTDLFPLAYHHSADVSNKDFTLNYKQCLKENIDNISPFGDIPKQIAQTLSKSLEATRLLLQAFSIGIKVLNTTDTLLIDEHSTGSSECHDALLKMTYCPKCLGLTKHTKPCSGYCLNVLRGCITKYVAELDMPWNGYVEGIEGLVNAMKKPSNDAGVNVDAVIRNLDTQISAAIMYSMEKIKDIDGKVKLACKTPEFSQKEDPLVAAESSTPAPTAGHPRMPLVRLFSPPPDAQLGHFLAAVGQSRGFYANLADALCKDESFAEQRDQRCWNGDRVAEYTKTVVDVGLNMQKYNPEVKASPNMQNVDPRVADLVDKLRHVHHMALSSLGPNYPEADYMQRDGVDGSGSGNGPDFDDGDDEYTRGSGSGHGPIETDSHEPTSTREDSPNDERKLTPYLTPTVHVVRDGSLSLTPPVTLLLLLLTIVAVLPRN